MNKILKNVLIFGIPVLILIIVVSTVIKSVRGGEAIKPCPSETPYRDGLDGPCLQCDPSRPLGCRECTANGNECKNGGICHTEENWGDKGICICPPGISGLTCENVCSSDSNCNGGKCVNNICECPNGKYGPKCEKSLDAFKCVPPSGCNSMMINTFTAKKLSPDNWEFDISIEDANIQSDEDIPVKAGDKIYIGGFPSIDVFNWNSLNTWNTDPSKSWAYTIKSVSSLDDRTDSSGENKGSCYYYCPKTTSTSCDNPEGPFTYDVCNDFRNDINDSNCFQKGCLKYFTITLDMSNFTNKSIQKQKKVGGNIGIMLDGIDSGVFNYMDWNSGAYIHLPASDGYEQKYPAFCYSNTKSLDGEQCTGCAQNWGPGQSYTEGGDVWDNYKNKDIIPVGGWCGRIKNAKTIALSADNIINPYSGGNPTDNCQKYFGQSSCGIDPGLDNCQTGNGSRGLCAVTDFWAFPGTACQTGKWNRCDTCFSASGANDITESSEKCGLIGASNPSFANVQENVCPNDSSVDYNYLPGDPNASDYCPLPSNTSN